VNAWQHAASGLRTGTCRRSSQPRPHCLPRLLFSRPARCPEELSCRDHRPSASPPTPRLPARPTSGAEPRRRNARPCGGQPASPPASTAPTGAPRAPPQIIAAILPGSDRARRRSASGPAARQRRSAPAPPRHEAARALAAQDSPGQAASQPAARPEQDRAGARCGRPPPGVAIRGIHKADASPGDARNRAGAGPFPAVTAARHPSSAPDDQPGGPAGGQLADDQSADVPRGPARGRAHTGVAEPWRALPARPGDQAEHDARALTRLRELHLAVRDTGVRAHGGGDQRARSAPETTPSWLRHGFAQRPGKRIVKAKLRTQASVPAQFSDRTGKGPVFFSSTPTRCRRCAAARAGSPSYRAFFSVTRYRRPLPDGITEESVWASSRRQHSGLRASVPGTPRSCRAPDGLVQVGTWLPVPAGAAVPARACYLITARSGRQRRSTRGLVPATPAGSRRYAARSTPRRPAWPG
jgi:hypothetical protein